MDLWDKLLSIVTSAFIMLFAWENSAFCLYCELLPAWNFNIWYRGVWLHVAEF